MNGNLVDIIFKGVANCVVNAWACDGIAMFYFSIEYCNFHWTVCVGRTKCEKRVETFPITKKAVAKVSANGVQWSQKHSRRKPCLGFKEVLAAMSLSYGLGHLKSFWKLWSQWWWFGVSFESLKNWRKGIHPPVGNLFCIQTLSFGRTALNPTRIRVVMLGEEPQSLPRVDVRGLPLQDSFVLTLKTTLPSLLCTRPLSLQKTRPRLILKI